MKEVVEAENAADAKIAADTVEAVDIPCLSSTTLGLIKRGIDGQEQITEDLLKRKGAGKFHRDFFFDGIVFILQLFCHEAFCHKN